MGRTEAVIAREEAKAWAAIEPFKPRFKGKKVLLITGGVKSWSVVASVYRKPGSNLLEQASRNRREKTRNVSRNSWAKMPYDR